MVVIEPSFEAIRLEPREDFFTQTFTALPQARE
jgi:hypothetical protein